MHRQGAIYRRGRICCHCLLVETDACGLVLVDTGFGRQDIAEPARFGRAWRFLCGPRLDPAETAHAQVTALGYRPEDVQHIVVTHLDLDHAGGLSDFPWAQVHLHHRELLAATARASIVERERYAPEHWAHGPKWASYTDDGDDWFGFRAVRALEGLDDTVALVPLSGHSRGHSAVAVRDGDRWLLHAGDAYYHHDEIQTGSPPPLGFGLLAKLAQIDATNRAAWVSRLRDLNREHASEVSIFCAHDPEELERFAGSEPAC